MGEDALMNLRLSFATDKTPTIVNKKVYNYLTHTANTMNTHKRTMASMLTFEKHLIASIPKEEYHKYILARTKQRAFTLQVMAYERQLPADWTTSEWAQLFFQEAKQCNYSFSWRIKGLIACRNQKLQEAFVLIWRILNRLHLS